VHTRLNDLDAAIIDRLFKLSTSSYSDVRKDAQVQLFDMLSHFPFSFIKIAPKIKELLSDKNVSHDALKGCLFILKGNNLQSSLMIKHNWSVIEKIWPALFRCDSYEKPSIVALVDQVMDNTNKNFDTFSYSTRLSEKCMTMALNLYSNDFLASNKSNEAIRLKQFNRKKDESFALSHAIVSDIIQLLAPVQNTSWRNQTLAFGTLIFLFHPYGDLTRDYVNVFVQALVHDNVLMRKTAIAGMCIILKVLKSKKEKKEYDTGELLSNVSQNVCKPDAVRPGERDDNVWHHYSSRFQIPQTDEEWFDLKFVDKTYMGYNCWPRKLAINQTRRRFQTRANQVVQPIYDCFTNDEFVTKFFRMLALEDNDDQKFGLEKFDMKRFHLFKGQFSLSCHSSRTPNCNYFVFST
jgi:hypothetical protein